MIRASIAESTGLVARPLSRGEFRNHPRLLIEEWLPAAASGVECIRERWTGQQPPRCLLFSPIRFLLSVPRYLRKRKDT